MKNLALVINGKVKNIIIANDDFIGENYIEYSDENPAMIGGGYEDGFFYEPQPYPSWTRTGSFWNAPIPMPEDDKHYTWDEATTSWVEVTL